MPKRGEVAEVEVESKVHCEDWVRLVQLFFSRNDCL